MRVRLPKRPNPNDELRSVSGGRGTHPGPEFGSHVDQHDEDGRRGDQRAELPNVRHRIVVGLRSVSKTKEPIKSSFKMAARWYDRTLPISSKKKQQRGLGSHAVGDEEDDGALVEGVDDVDPERVRAVELRLAADDVQRRVRHQHVGRSVLIVDACVMRNASLVCFFVYQVLPGFTMFYRVLPSFNGFYRV